jgi:hypothetical protein
MSNINKKIRIEGEPGQTDDQFKAKQFLRPTLRSAITVLQCDYASLKDIDIKALMDELGSQVSQVSKGDLGRGEAMLTAQAHTLDALFHKLTQKALSADYTNQLETYMRLALKAQNQTRTTWEAISRIQNPTVNYVKQANIAHNQQINNGKPESVSEKPISPNKLLEEEDYERLDGGAKAPPIGVDQELETVGAVHRSSNGGRKE